MKNKTKEQIEASLTPVAAAAWVIEGLERGFIDVDRGIQFLTGEAGRNSEHWEESQEVLKDYQLVDIPFDYKDLKLLHEVLNYAEARATDSDDPFHQVTEELEAINITVVTAIGKYRIAEDSERRVK
tara:strand:- start:80 stop:460 length:381 start_codon:yes stop_codon:yes gene_type:complete